MRKKGFTLVEIVVIILIMAIITGGAVLNVGAGMKSARLRDAARTVQLYTRHAKAVALLKQRPVVLQFEEICENGVFVKSRMSLAFSGDAKSGGGAIGVGRNGSGASDGLTRTLSGLVVGQDDGASPFDTEGPGEEIDALMAEPREFEGIRVVAKLKEREADRPRISVFSNVDVLLKKKAAEQEKARAEAAAREEARLAAARKAGQSATETTEEEKEEEEKESSFSVVYEANGRCEPFIVTVYKDGADERDGLVVSIGRFGRTVTGD